MSSKIRFSVVRFPGSNCDYDSYHIPDIRGNEVSFVWHKDHDLKNPDVVILPGGFSYGDYLRAGAIAKFSPIINEVVQFARKGGYVIGICNGFQVLTETGLLPGALMMNNTLKFICKHQFLKPVNTNNIFTFDIKPEEVLDIPIAHKDGNYFISEDGLKGLQDNNQIAFRYCDKDGNITEEANPNGSIYNIAGVYSKNGNILGMMPHPERAAEDTVVSHDGTRIFDSIEKYIK